jgi:hypothetical protein
MNTLAQDPVDQLSSSDCDHKFVYSGVRYAEGSEPLPGTGAVARYYAHVYFCERCLQERGQPIRGPHNSSYFSVQHNATPGDPDTVGVPEYDREGWRWKQMRR